MLFIPGCLIRCKLDDLRQVHLGVQALDLAVGHERVEQRIVDAGLETSEEQEIVRADFCRPHLVFG